VAADEDPTVVVARAPGRVVLIGDHTDHAGGVSLTMAIDRFTTITGRRGGDRVRLTSDQLAGEADVAVGAGAGGDPGEGPGWGRLVAGVVAEVTPSAGLVGRVESTVPVGAGLSSSAALELAVALAVGFEGSPLELARAGQRAERRALGVPCGLLDQLTVASGLEGHALLLDLADDAVRPVALPAHLEVVVVHSGEERRLEGSAYAERHRQCQRAAEEVGPLPRATPAAVEAVADPVLRRRARHVASECRRVHEARRALEVGDGAAVGALMVESHRSLRDDFEVSTPALDELVARLTARPGVLGARLTGAGFGGCVVALCEVGAVADPASFTGRGWRVRPAGGASLRPAGVAGANGTGGG
jgi:galactokinase